MIRETKTQQEVIIRHKYCDVCGVEINHSLACSIATCMYCGKDLCEKCIGYEEGTSGDYRDVWCKQCWNIGAEYRPKIEELNKEAETLCNEWQEECKGNEPHKKPKLAKEDALRKIEKLMEQTLKIAKENHLNFSDWAITKKTMYKVLSKVWNK